MKIFSAIKKETLLPAMLLFAWGGGLPALQAQSISEPHTVFYGKVLGTASAQDFLITEGKLVWTIERADGVSITLETSLYPLHDNTYSYRLNVPHSALALGLPADVGGIPLPPTPQINIHTEVTVDGQPAVLLGPASSTFTTEQLLRTATYRMDLGLNRTAVDTDGDGIPDWWEDLYGLDKQDPSDAAQDLSGDGLSALQAYLQGLDPHHDARAPELLTQAIVVYPSGSTGVLLDSADLDSTAEALTYTLTRLPHVGTLTLRNAQTNPTQPDVVLTAGSQFTQADVLNGRLIYDHDGSLSAPGSIDIEVRDENPAHPVGEGTVELLVYEPGDMMPEVLSAREAQRVDNYLYAEAGYVIMDGTALPTNTVMSSPSAGLSAAALDDYIATYGLDRSYKFLSASGSSTAASGGHRSDVLVAGTDGGTLTGGPGADWFVAESFETGRITITDFIPAELDVIDLSRLPAAPIAFVHHYLRLVQTGGVYQIQTDLDGNGAGFTNLTVALPGLTAAEADLYTLIESGRLLVGSLQLEPMISVVASQSQASENGPSSGIYTLTRRGQLIGELTVNLLISGSAQNGTDYQWVPSTVLMPEGMDSVEVAIVPYADGITESAESVQLTLTAGTGYRIGAPSQAIVTIEDQLMLVDIEAVDPIAVKASGASGRFMITRRDVINRDVVIRLVIGGTAANGVDYDTLSTLVYMAPNQSVAFLQVHPKAGAVLAGGAETVKVSIKPDANYRVADAGHAEVLLIERTDSFADWRAREFPEATGDAATFAATDEGGTGVTRLQRYAFGLDPHQPDRSGLPHLIMQDGKLVVTFRKPAGIDDVQYRVLASTDLMEWDAHAVSVEPVAAPTGSSDPLRVYYQALVDDDHTAFIVVEVEWTP